MECRIDANRAACSCPSTTCDNKGLCCECLRFHVSKRTLPFCCFGSAGVAGQDRSFETFAQWVREKKI